MHVRDGLADPIPDYYFWICAADGCNTEPWEMLRDLVAPNDPQPSRLWWGHASILVANARSEAQDILQKKASKTKGK